MLSVAELDRTALPYDRLSDGFQPVSCLKKVMPTLAAAEEDTPLVECAENIAVSIPAAVNTALSQRATELEVTALCGLMKEVNNLVSSPHIGLVLSSLALRVITGHKVGFPGKEGREKSYL